LDRFEKSSDKNLMRFNKAKSKVLHLDQSNPRCVYRLGEELIECSPSEKNLGDKKLAKSNRLPREVVDAPFLEAFKARLDEVLHSLI